MQSPEGGGKRRTQSYFIRNHLLRLAVNSDAILCQFSRSLSLEMFTCPNLFPGYCGTKLRNTMWK